MKKQRAARAAALFITVFMAAALFPAHTAKGASGTLPKSFDMSKKYDAFEIKTANVTVSLFGKKILEGDGKYFIKGRIYLPLIKSVQAAGGRVIDEGDAYVIENESGAYRTLSKKCERLGVYQVCSVDGTVYVGLPHFTEIMELSAVVDSAENKLELYKSMGVTAQAKKQPPSANSRAYLRFEDIMANGRSKGEGVYNDANLNKFRLMADYMAQNGQSFYIAWIPLYINPAERIENNLTRDINLYNAGFLYTLDYLVMRGGQIVLHGLTHQYKDDISGVGNEFGRSSPFTAKEREDRMIRAKKMAAELGVDDSIFEFPHYSATDADLRLAEKHFDIIYQAYPGAASNIKAVKTSSGRSVSYVPTPADHVRGGNDVDDTLSRISSTYKQGMVVSLFFHPRMDADRMTYRVENQTLTWKYADNAVLPRLVGKVKELGLTFSALPVPRRN